MLAAATNATVRRLYMYIIEPIIGLNSSYSALSCRDDCLNIGSLHESSEGVEFHQFVDLHPTFLDGIEERVNSQRRAQVGQHQVVGISPRKAPKLAEVHHRSMEFLDSCAV
mmetsp:Transcript_8833/g.17247  ORF Transcript_8833/g.17247 Transcript_8833/m.17247 type:complete len:111 (+) Transcript_8833:269-601(+)